MSDYNGPVQAYLEDSGLSKETVLELLHHAMVREGSHPHSVLKLLDASADNFAEYTLVRRTASPTSENRKTKTAVLARLMEEGYIEKGYRITPLGKKALEYARPLLKARKR